MLKNLCQYRKTCPIYNGEKEINGDSLVIYKNVFCHRGFKGWNNCEQFLDYKKHELIEKNENDQ